MQTITDNMNWFTVLLNSLHLDGSPAHPSWGHGSCSAVLPGFATVQQCSKPTAAWCFPQSYMLGKDRLLTLPMGSLSQEQAAWALQALTAGSPGAQAELARAGGVPRLLGLLALPEAWNWTPVARTLRNVAGGGRSLQEKLTAAGAVPVLVDLLTFGRPALQVGGVPYTRDVEACTVLRCSCSSCHRCRIGGFEYREDRQMPDCATGVKLCFLHKSYNRGAWRRPNVPW